MKKKHIVIIFICLLSLLIFLFRWSIIDSILFVFVSPENTNKLEKYSSANLKFSVEYPSTLSDIKEKDDIITFGNWVVPLISVRVITSNNSDIVENSSYYPDDIGYSLNSIDNNLVITRSLPAKSGAGGRLFITYYTTNGKTYLICTTSYPSEPEKYSLYKQFLSTFKPI